MSDILLVFRFMNHHKDRLFWNYNFNKIHSGFKIRIN